MYQTLGPFWPAVLDISWGRFCIYYGPFWLIRAALDIGLGRLGDGPFSCIPLIVCSRCQQRLSQIHLYGEFHRVSICCQKSTHCSWSLQSWEVALTPWGTGGTCPHFYKWLGTGGTVSRTANKKLTKLYWPSWKRSPKRQIVLLEPKSGGARPKTFFRVPPSTFNFVPAPLIVRICLHRPLYSFYVFWKATVISKITCNAITMMWLIARDKSSVNWETQYTDWLTVGGLV